MLFFWHFSRCIVDAAVDAEAEVFMEEFQDVFEDEAEEMHQDKGLALHAWQLEVDRVLPLLKLHVKETSVTWRMRFDQLLKEQQRLEQNTLPLLQPFQTEIASQLDKVAKREKYVAEHCDVEVKHSP